jgi:saccharopine dehydrogenase-like NADP-dependent oxidoreductase
MKVLVLGGCGAIGRVVVRDLFEFNPGARILVADYNEAAARACVTSFRSKRVTAAFADASKPAALARLFRGWPIVVNCTQHIFNLHVMEACLRAKSHYLDLGGLFTWTRKQMRLDRRFRDAGLVAVLGAGCSPGITNVMAMHAASKVERVTSVRIRVGSRDFSPRSAGFVFPYSAQTIVEEMTLPPWVFEAGRFKAIKPRTRWERVPFPKPVGPAWTVCTRHSEIATLPYSLHEKGIKRCDFKVSFDRAFVSELVRRMKAGWTVDDFRKLPAPRVEPDDVEVARVVVEGPGQTVTMDCTARPNRRWKASAGDIDTGCPPSIVARMMADGMIPAPGVWAPEQAIPARPFFAALRKRGMNITEH